jgi:diadenosine tetraphosphate (Ap4A) HIT family hydrolase
MNSPSAPLVRACPLCEGPGGEILWQGDRLRVILADEPANPGFTRVIWTAHVAEMTDLPGSARAALMAAVWTVEAAMREVMRPDKVNLASLGNAVPHLHWHVIPRWRDDAQFPQPVWAAPVPGREAGIERLRLLVEQAIPAYRRLLAQRLIGC